MPASFRLVLIPLIATVAALSLSGCASTGPSMGDLIPQWAGGEPADVPPRPGTPQYDAFMKERERRRQMPATERDKLPPVGSEAAPTTPAQR
jgi:hypothetical protein